MKKVLVLIGVLFALFGCFLVLRYLTDMACGSYSLVESPDVISPSKEALARFSGGLKIKTISNPDYEKTDFGALNNFISYIKKTYPLVFKECKFETVNKYNLVFKLKGKNSDKLPNILTAHYDVVGVKDEKNWEHSPFSGDFDEEYIYSRGTIDDKGAVFGILEALNDLLKEGYVPESDLYIAFSHCEETGSIEGAPKVIEYFKKKNIKFDIALDEGGRIVNKNGNHFAFIGTAEKGRLLTKITVFGKASHASSPSYDSAVYKLAKLITAFENNPKKAELSKDIEAYYKETYSSYDNSTKFLLSNKNILKPLLFKKLSKNQEDNARIRSTFAITILEASNIQNAVSGNASMFVDSRILPGETTNDIKQFIDGIIKKTMPGEEVKVEYLSIMEPSVSNGAGSAAFNEVSDVIKKLYPEIPVSPYLTLGATDAREYAEISDNTFRFLPCVLTPDEAGLMHSDNEKISIKNWGRMITFYKEFMRTR